MFGFGLGAEGFTCDFHSFSRQWRMSGDGEHWRESWWYVVRVNKILVLTQDLPRYLKFYNIINNVRARYSNSVDKIV